MLTPGHATTDTATADPQAPPQNNGVHGPGLPTDPSPAEERRALRRLRWLAVLLGGLGTILALLFPFLPVVQDTATIQWPSPTTGTRSVDAPLVAFRPQTMSASIPCAAVRSLDARAPQRATVLSTTPPLSPSGLQVGLQLYVDNGQLTLTDRGQQSAQEPVPAGPCNVTITSDGAQTVINLGAGADVVMGGDFRPQVVGIYSDLDAAKDPTAGTSVQVVPDTRFQTTATALKVTAGILAILCFLGAVWALHALDTRAGRRAPRLAPRRWWRPTARDAVVLLGLAVWAVIGSQTSDDGYILGIARARESAGYIGNYYRWFNVPEAPFGWFYEVYSVWVQVSDNILWMRLPSVFMGIVSWLLISREMLPRLGVAVRRSKAAGWAAAMVFLMFWLPFNNGLRPEPVAVISALLAFCAVERAVATRRLAPVALGLVAAAFALAATPTGLMAVAPFLAAARPLFRLVQERVRRLGWLPVLAPILASGVVVLTAIFADQTFAAVMEANRVRFLIGPNYTWYQEVVRYESLFSVSADGSLERRAPVLLLILGLVVCLVVLLRRDRIRGAALGPSQRLIGTTLLGFVVLALTPTKWTHHFGAFAALGSGMAALTALATSSDVLRSRRNRSLFLAAVFATLALAFTGPNTWWYTNNWGVPWNDKSPSYHHHQASTLLLAVAGIFLVVAAIEHMRGIQEQRPPSSGAWQPAGRLGRLVAPVLSRAKRVRGSRSASAVERRARALRVGSAPIAVVCGLLVLFEMASMGKGIDKQWNSFSLGGDVVKHPFSTSCGLADQVRVEGSPAAGILPPAPPFTGVAPSAKGVLPTIAPQTPVAPGQQPAPLPPDTVQASSPLAQLVDPNPLNQGFHAQDATPPTGGGTGVSGYEYTLRNDLAGQTLGTFDKEGRGTGILRTRWQSVDDSLRSGQTPLVISVAGRLNGGNSLYLQYAKHLPDGRIQITGQDPIDDGAGGEPPWREIKVNLASGKGAQADEIRLVAQDRALGVDGWMALAPMRGPKLVPFTQAVGQQPGYLEWPVQFASPCLKPFDVRDGIAEVPTYRLIADASQFRIGGETWSQPSAGGPMGWIEVLEKQQDVPSYLQGESTLDWGRIEKLEPYAPNTAAPDVVRGTKTVWGLHGDGEIGDPPPGIPSPER
ncbi:arabinosyltransferase domain-containing protein [Actinomycetospora sp. TBRC 11914]|uniref:arabinosyltransferase domain-containing protein n=1 Tax=Actinomycetospora sp. TBRC 11914 TaxID=2729387 RepID=UPI00145EB8A8|nr:arabinosyltransferase domain-containing protein [Actinomycetospora sp. TBRC 11914]NMO90043.1 arabinosyltransferase [Actinomycetospora sp. TBRC 11914]